MNWFALGNYCADVRFEVVRWGTDLQPTKGWNMEDNLV